LKILIESIVGCLMPSYIQ